MMELVKCIDVNKNFGDKKVLKNINLVIPRGKIIGLLGKNGQGKSTLIKMLYREERPDKGSIFIGGIDVARLKDRKVYILRRKLGVVFQDFKLLPKAAPKSCKHNLRASFFALALSGGSIDKSQIMDDKTSSSM